MTTGRTSPGGPAYAVVGASGNIGRATLAALRARGARARVVLRPARDEGPWRRSSVETALADLADGPALARAFAGVAAAFVLNAGRIAFEHEADVEHGRVTLDAAVSSMCAAG